MQARDTEDPLHVAPASVQARALGAYLGLAVGDALGATVEFMTPSEIQNQYGVHREICGGGWLALPAGDVTDDTEMSLAMGRAILRRGGFQVRAVADAFAEWLRSGPRDCGNTCRRGIVRYVREGSLAGPMNEEDGGNGALMRNLPVVLCSLGDDAAFREHTLAQCHLTHHHPLSDAAALCFGRMAAGLILGGQVSEAEALADALVAEHGLFAYRTYRGPATAYVVDTVCTVLKCFIGGTDFESIVVNAVNRGDDADTTGALAGMLAGARFGVQGIPARWLAALRPEIRQEVSDQVSGLIALSSGLGMR